MSGLYPNEYQKMNRTGTAKKKMKSNQAGIARMNRGARRRGRSAPAPTPFSAVPAATRGSGSRGGLRLVPDVDETALGLVHGSGVHRPDLLVGEEHEVEELETGGLRLFLDSDDPGVVAVIREVLERDL